MQIEIIEKKREPQPVELVEGGVYRCIPIGGGKPFYRLLVRMHGKFATFDLEEGELGLGFRDADEMRLALGQYYAEYVPNAKLVLEID